MSEFTSENIRTELWSTLRDLRGGKLTPQAALAAAKVAQTIVNSARADLEATRFISEVQTPEGIDTGGRSSVVRPMSLGTARG